jgi:hypothetical protein
VEEPGDERALGQVVVDLDRLAGLGHVHSDGALFQVAVGGRVNLQLLVMPWESTTVVAPRASSSSTSAGGYQVNVWSRFRSSPRRVRRPGRA